MNETQIHLRLTKAMRAEVESYAEIYGTTVPAAARILIRKGLDAAKKENQS